MTPDAWIEAVASRHAGSMSRSEFLKAVRALSVRYVERRVALPERSPIDSAGKRAAFAGFFAPLHFLLVRAILRRLGGPPPDVATLVDAGCGTGVAGAAWALASTPRPALTGIDVSEWAQAETRAAWRDLGLNGRARRGDFVAALERLADGAGLPAPPARLGVVLGWSLNELDPPARERAQRALAGLGTRGAAILVIEPVARAIVPWWDAWARRPVADGARADEWRFPPDLPAPLAALDRDAGFRRDALTARSLAVNWGRG